MDAEIETVLARVIGLWGAAYSHEFAHSAADRAARDTAVAIGLLAVRGPGFFVVPGTDERAVTARRFHGYLTCASAAEVLGYPLQRRPDRVHVAVPLRYSVRSTATRPTDGVRLHRVRDLSPMTVENVPLVVAAEVVARCLVCLDEPDAIAVADAALHRHDVTRADVTELLVGRYAISARARLAQAEPAARSLIETRLRLCLRRAGFQVECGVLIAGVGEVDHLVEGWLIVETDGYEFHSSPEQFRRDRGRDQAAGAAGYVTVRLDHDTVMAGDQAILDVVCPFMVGVAHSNRIALPKNVAILRKYGYRPAAGDSPMCTAPRGAHGRRNH